MNTDIRYIFLGLVEEDRPGVQLCDLQKTLYQCLDPVQFLFGETGKFLDDRQTVRFPLQDAVVDIQGGQGRFELMGDIRDGPF